MSEEILLQYVKSIDERTARMDERATRMEMTINAAFMSHQQNDDERHEKIDTRLKSLETSRTAARAAMAGVAMAGTGGAAKLGLIDKLMSFIGFQG